MAVNNLSALKRTRQNLKRRAINKSLKGSLKTQYKLLSEAVKGNKKNESLEYVRIYVSLLDRAAKKNILHKNNVNRKKARAMKMIKTIKNEKKESLKD